MAKIKKILITPFFGELPPWWEAFKPHFSEFLARSGYAWLFTQDFRDFNDRCEDRLGFRPRTIVWGSGKLWDYRPALGLIYADLIKDFDFWGHTDFDCVFGDVGKWVSDEFLADLDVHSNHGVYVCGCWTLYRNISRVNNLFREGGPEWVDQLKAPEPTGWVEGLYSRWLEASGLRYKYTFWQGDPYTATPKLEYKDGQLFQYPEFKYAPGVKTREEIMMFHFRRSKKWPL